MSVGRLIVGGALGACLTICQAQTNLNFNNVSVTVEGAIRLSWNSTPGEIYEIDEADSLIDTNTGSITWNVLYEDYPSQGTNTFWLDTGNYFADPEIPHPFRSTERYYRIALTGTNETATVPAVAVSSPTNNASLNGDVTVTVSAYSDQFFLSTKLYVDGQEMNSPDVSTNWTDDSFVTNFVQDTYIINTCEWPNGSHLLFATTSCQSGAAGVHDGAYVSIGYGVSSFVPVTFSNLITRISFSEPFFMPEDGQTQQVRAVFAANVNWTLEMQDINTNTVLSTNGSGGSMVFNWDGTGYGGTNLPVGTYTYLITAETNGQSLADSGGSESSASAFSETSSESERSRLWVQQPDGGIFPLCLYPPGINTNDFYIFEAPWSWNPWQESTSSQSTPSSSESGGDTGATPLYSGASSQSSRAPKRPPTHAVKGRAGVYGIAYQTYSANGSGFVVAPPDNGLHINQRVALEGKSVSQSTFNYIPLKPYKREANNFIEEMKKANWSQGFAKVDDKLSINDLRASGANIYNSVKLGLLMLHGTYGSAPDYNASGTKQIYFPITSGHSATYLRANEMSLGNADTNGLKWMGILACNSMQHTSWSSMQGSDQVPYNGNLHLILGSDSVIWTGDYVPATWAKYMAKGKTPNPPMTIENAWFTGAQDAYRATGFAYTNTQKFAASGNADCQGDKLDNYSDPSGDTFYLSQQVWP